VALLLGVGVAVVPGRSAAAPDVTWGTPVTAAGDSGPAPKPVAAAHDSAAQPEPAAAELDSTDVSEPDDADRDTAPAARPKPVRKAPPAKFHVTSADTTRRQPPTEPKGFDRPSWVMLRSLAFPGWGQAHNHAWTKAAAIAGVESFFIVRLVADQNDLNRLNTDIEHAASNPALQQDLVDEYNTRSDRFIGHQWWLGALLAYSMLDAYIDAHFRNFRIDLEDDPALPPEERRAAGLKLSWQEHF
jgi:hypothetical protein